MADRRQVVIPCLPACGLPICNYCENWWHLKALSLSAIVSSSQNRMLKGYSWHQTSRVRRCEPNYQRWNALKLVGVAILLANFCRGIALHAVAVSGIFEVSCWQLTVMPFVHIRHFISLGLWVVSQMLSCLRRRRRRFSSDLSGWNLVAEFDMT